MRYEDAVPVSRCAPQISGWWLFAILAVTLAPAAPAQTFTVLHAFTGSPDGSQPQFGVILDRQGNVFGNTWAGGCTTGCDGGGTIYKIDTTGTESVLYAFGNVPNDAFHPNSQLLIDGLGNLYGVTQNGGASGHGCQGPGCGTGYRIAPDGTETILFNFPSAGLTQLPNPPLLLGVGGVYGTADGLADSEDGAVYKFDGAGISVLHQFTGGSDGAWPFYGLTQDASGNLFGVTFHEKAGRSQVDSFLFLLYKVYLLPRLPLSPCFHPHSRGANRFARCMLGVLVSAGAAICLAPCVLLFAS